MKYAKITATGSYLPEKVLTNDELAKMVDTSDEWITKRTGIKQRHIAADSETVASLGVKAAFAALNDNNIAKDDIDLIVVATCSQDKIFPSTACQIQSELGITCQAFDVQAACSGFIYALNVANNSIKVGETKKALVIGTEVMSRTLDWQDRATCVLFGDGAGAVILEASDNPGILSTEINADGSYQDILYLNNAKMSEDKYLQMQGSTVFKQAVKALGDIAVQVIEKSPINQDELDWLVPHQANIRIIQATAKKLNLSDDKIILTVAKHANTSAASIPLALDIAVRDGRIQRGHNILLEAFGGGLAYGAALIKY